MATQRKKKEPKPIRPDTAVLLPLVEYACLNGTP